MDVFEAIRTRRTVKVFGGEPLTRDQLDELFELARWAPNHKLTGPWRFRVLGPETRAALKQAAGEVATASAPEGADAEKIAFVAGAKIDRAPTLVAVSSVRNPDPVLDTEDYSATAVAAYIVLLAAHAKGYAGYWRTPEVLRNAAGIDAVGISPEEEVLGLLYLGHPAGAADKAPERGDVEEFASYLD
jgi:nitroreductase